MITLIDNCLELTGTCELVSCRFDPDAAKDQTHDALKNTWGIQLPEKLQRAVPKRLAEFIAGRYCANLALQRLRSNDQVLIEEIQIGDKREPLWPTDVIGSITHSHGFAAAVVADTAQIRGVGIDSEQLINPNTANNVASHILREEEVFQENQHLVLAFEQYLTLVFSAKESIYKCLFPLVKQYFDFKDARITLSNDAPGQFKFELTKNLTDEFGVGYSGTGIYRAQADFIHTAVVLTD